MNKSKVWLIVSILCIVVGAAMLLGSGVRSGEDLGWLLQSAGAAEMQEEKTVEVTESFHSLYVLESSSDIKLLPAGDGRCRVVYGETEYSHCTVSVKDGTLSVTREELSNVRRGLILYSKSIPLRIYLPAGSYENLEILISSGDVEVDRGFSWDSAKIESGSGDIELQSLDAGTLRLGSTNGDIKTEELQAESLQVDTGSGDMELRRCSLGSLSLGSTSGEQTLKDCSVDGAAALSTGSGDITLEDCTVGSLSVSGTSSEVRLTKTDCGESIKVSTGSGDIRLRDIRAESYDLSSTSGDVKGILRGSVDFMIETTSGSIRTRGGVRGAAPCQVHTASGDVDLEAGS